MPGHIARDAASWVARFVLAATVVALGALLGRAATPATASVPAALQIAERALSSATALEDESPYQLIDPVGPGGITQRQAMGEVASSTMQGGLYNDNGRYNGGYGQQYFVPAAPPHGSSGGWVPHGGSLR